MAKKKGALAGVNRGRKAGAAKAPKAPITIRNRAMAGGRRVITGVITGPKGKIALGAIGAGRTGGRVVNRRTDQRLGPRGGPTASRRGEEARARREGFGEAQGSADV